MHPPHSSDPASIAGHRLLGRLGAGGMGVVHLARSAGGALVALKVVHAEFAQDGGFRERFRREVDTLRRVRSPWVVPFVAADPDAPAPWLATAFVAGPSLEEAVAAHGPLPPASARALGRRLAEALRDVHAAGLVHRDVKPANVLLALDGPRLIDFGIAREPEDTALTATGLVVGTPGFLAPEQVQGGGRDAIGPPSDVFALGCVLAYAQTGRPPFGTGPVDALLFRAVHESPDLDGVPEESADLLRRCLEKDPAPRPSAAEVARALAAPRDGADEPHWLPEAVTRLVADRAAAGAALPDIEPTAVDAGAAGRGEDGATDADGTGTDGAGTDGAGTDGAAGRPPEAAPADGDEEAEREEADGPGRRRFLLLTGGGALAAGGGALALWRWRDGDGGTSAARPAHTIALQADLSGDARRTGTAQLRGVRLAVQEFNARRDAPFTLSLVVRDDGGDPQRAAATAEELAADSSVLAVVGPTTEAAAEAVLPVYDRALLPLVSVTAGAVKLLVLGARSFVQARPHNSLLPFFLSAHLRGTAGSRTIGIVNDRAAGDYGWEIAGTLSKLLNQGGHPYVPKVVSGRYGGFGPAIDALLAGGADSVVFAGLHERGARFARTLHERGFTGPRAAAHGLLDPRFVEAAGEAAEGWVIAAPALDPAEHPGAERFTAAHRARFDAPPAPFAAEAYDATGLVAHALRGLAARRRTRGNLTAAIRGTSYRGITQTLSFSEENGSRTIDGTGVHLWRVAGGRLRYTGPGTPVIPG
ncbi:bifunctional serine/threonine-protein kinase/ABC transporter substrate-binding protein [Streptomyces sp. C10-9-1]|uniref:bifunctional serine/threonine-protein kinase/ABC transporter substrate-binding protein n=1 Tax=Streptomyces sp. C10-9-1 TaxID=1859285 RepID=UPI0021133A85|nr:bifunctional serine/threonine-protein kinase/ABC transporter substrate-binding protein [Streptomyces sp. C10-9-1]MCQ6552067.1 bifunctional serine/threonine-protein kinase/ABC transporter substrate-binding protein [Streptomyces sp. C10-9-1]